MRRVKVLSGLLVVLFLTGRILADDISAENLTIAQSATFGTVLYGQSSNYTTLNGYTFHVTQPSISNPTEVMNSSYVEGHYEYQTVWQEVYGWLEGGYYEDYYTWGVIGTEWHGPVYDEYGTEIQAGYFSDLYGNVWAGQQWVSSPYWGVTGTEPVNQETWIDGYYNTWSEIVDDPIYGAPRLEFDASRSDANWVWRNPSAENPGTFKDILILWDGGLRIPSLDSNRMMALTSERLTQSITSWGGSSATTKHTTVAAEEIDAISETVNGPGNSGVRTIDHSKISPGEIRITRTTQQSGSSVLTGTTLTPSVATFGGNVQVAGIVNIAGGIKLANVPIEERFLLKTVNSISVGSNSSADGGGVALGQNSKSMNESISIGLAAGVGGTAPGLRSLSLGAESFAGGTQALAIGTLSHSHGTGSIAIGPGSESSADRSIAIGQGSKANLPGQLVLGAFNLPSPPSASMAATDDLLVIGNGQSDEARNNALVLKRNGDLHVQGNVLTVNGQQVLTLATASNVFMPISQASEFLTPVAAGQLFQSKAPEGANYILDSEMIVAINQALQESASTERTLSNSLYLFKGEAEDDYLTKEDAGNIYATQEDLANFQGNGASVDLAQLDSRYLLKSHTVGLNYGTLSVAAPGTFAFGNSAAASGTHSSAIGNGAISNSEGSHAVGNSVVANRPDQVVVGAFNDYGEELTTSTDRVPEDAIFVVGNGTGGGASTRSNALEVRRNGDVTVSGVLRVQPAGNLSMGNFTSGPQP